jgi:adenosylhomocysteinase
MNLAAQGRRRMARVAARMPVMRDLRKRLTIEKPFSGLCVAFCSHLEAKTGYVATVIRDGGARVVVCGANSASTCDDVAEALRQESDIRVFARHGASPEEQAAFVRATVDAGPDLVADDGGDVITAYHENRLREAIGATEQTTTGVDRLRGMASLSLPVLGVNQCRSKHLIDNRYGTGESAMVAITKTTNATLRGSKVVVVGYGNCGRGIAAQARGMGARVTVTEIDPVKAMEASIEGFDVDQLARAVRDASFVITATGVAGVVGADVIDNMADGIYLSNAGHLDGEIDLDALSCMSSKVNRSVGQYIDEYVLRDGRRVQVIAGGSIVNLAAGDGHAAEIIDLTFALQVCALEYLVKNRDALAPGLQDLPDEVSARVALGLLGARGITIDRADKA